MLPQIKSGIVVLQLIGFIAIGRSLRKQFKSDDFVHTGGTLETYISVGKKGFDGAFGCNRGNGLRFPRGVRCCAHRL